MDDPSVIEELYESLDLYGKSQFLKIQSGLEQAALYFYDAPLDAVIGYPMIDFSPCPHGELLGAPACIHCNPYHYQNMKRSM